jgi:hypothetical protein
MPRQASPPRLWKRSERRDKDGQITHAATWIILYRGQQFPTGARYVVEWHDRPVGRIGTTFRRLVKDAGLDSKVLPHTLRHTAAI